MPQEKEYEKLRDEIIKHQEFCLRIMIFTMTVMGGIIGLKGKADVPSLMGITIIFLSSLVYLIGTARKIFTITAYLAVFHEDSANWLWHSHLPSFLKKAPLWFETQVIAIVYAIVSVSLGYFFFPTNPKLVSILIAIFLLLSLILFLMPRKIEKYKRYWKKVRTNSQVK